MSVTPTSAVVRYLATPLAQAGAQYNAHFLAIGGAPPPGSAQSSSAPLLRPGRPFAPRFVSDYPIPVCDPFDIDWYGTCGWCDPDDDWNCLPVPMPPPVGITITGFPPQPTINCVTVSPSTSCTSDQPATVNAGDSVTVTITGANFGASGFIQACPSDGCGGPCLPKPDSTTWGLTTITITWNSIPLTAAGIKFCGNVTALNFNSQSLASAPCAPLFFVFRPLTPAITSASPDGIVAGTSGSIQLTGQKLNQQPQASIDGSDVTVGVSGTPSATQLTISFQAPSNSVPGPRTLTVSTPYGSANTTIMFIRA